MRPEEKQLLLQDLCARLPRIDAGNTFNSVDRLTARHFNYRDLIGIGSIGKQEENQLLLRDLSARLPYGVK